MKSIFRSQNRRNSRFKKNSPMGCLERSIIRLIALVFALGTACASEAVSSGGQAELITRENRSWLTAYDGGSRVSASPAYTPEVQVMAVTGSRKMKNWLRAQIQFLGFR